MLLPRGIISGESLGYTVDNLQHFAESAIYNSVWMEHRAFPYV